MSSFFPGEEVAIAFVKRMGERFGFGNMISRLREAWAEDLRKRGLSDLAADTAAGSVCAWCQIDRRTGRKAGEHPMSPKPRVLAVTPERFDGMILHQNWVNGHDPDTGVTFGLTCGAGLGHSLMILVVHDKDGEQLGREAVDMADWLPQWVAGIMREAGYE